jgi:hypothetical protein
MVPRIAKWACRGESALRLDAAEVLHVASGRPAKVLPEPVEQRREVHCVPRRAPVVVAVRINRRAVVPNSAVAVEGQREERRGLEHATVPALERSSDRRWRHLEPRQVRRVLPAARRPLPPHGLRSVLGRADRVEMAPHPRLGDRLVQFDERRVKFGDLIPLGVLLSAVAFEHEVRPQPNERLLTLGGLVRIREWFVRSVPSFSALLLPQPASPFRARRAFVLAGGTTRQVDDLRLPAVEVGSPEQDRPGTDAVLDGHRLERVDGAGQQHPGETAPRPGSVVGREFEAGQCWGSHRPPLMRHSWS